MTARRRCVHFNLTEHPTAQWTSQQIVGAFPWDTAFQSRVKNLGIEEVKTAPHSPWQNPYCERAISSIRRECLDNVIVLNEAHLRRLLRSYVNYYHS